VFAPKRIDGKKMGMLLQRPGTRRYIPVLLFPALSVFALTTALLWWGCVVQEKCFQNADCESPRICNADGECVYECVTDSDCGPGFVCRGHLCRIEGGDEEPLTCPEDMVPVENVYCIDIYEASRPDATEDDEGVDDSVAVSKKDVMPWEVEDNQEAEAACEAAGKRLCSPEEWEFACKGPDDTVYAYGDEYEPKTCNGIDTFEGGGFHLTPTGAFPDCTNEFGVYDMNGNLWEHTLNGDGTTIRGGAYNCGNSKKFQRCDYIPRQWSPLAQGFRCCLVPEEDDNGGES